MTTDLRARLNEAGQGHHTIKQPCDAIAAFVAHALPEGVCDSRAHNHRVALLALIDRVRSGDLPRAILLGVVAAVVPAGRLWSIGSSADHSGHVAVMDRSGISHKASCPACALARAILDAMEGGSNG